MGKAWHGRSARRHQTNWCRSCLARPDGYSPPGLPALVPAVGLVPEHFLLEPLPCPWDPDLTADGRRVPDHLVRQVVGGEVAIHLAGPLGPVLDRVVGDSRSPAAQ